MTLVNFDETMVHLSQINCVLSAFIFSRLLKLVEGVVVKRSRSLSHLLMNFLLDYFYFLESDQGIYF